MQDGRCCWDRAGKGSCSEDVTQTDMDEESSTDPGRGRMSLEWRAQQKSAGGPCRPPSTWSCLPAVLSLAHCVHRSLRAGFCVDRMTLVAPEDGLRAGRSEGCEVARARAGIGLAELVAWRRFPGSSRED